MALDQAPRFCPDSYITLSHTQHNPAHQHKIQRTRPSSRDISTPISWNTTHSFKKPKYDVQNILLSEKSKITEQCNLDSAVHVKRREGIFACIFILSLKDFTRIR